MLVRQKNFIDITGMKFGMLSAMCYLRADRGAIWLFHCDCGKNVALRGTTVRKGRQRSCGCAKSVFQTKHFIEPGTPIGNITPLRVSGKHGHNLVWECQCSCKKTFTVLASNLISGNTKSCGCMKGQWCAETARTHGLASSAIYRLWHNMMRRCYDAKNTAFPNYGGRGIYVCDRWHAVDNFFADMGNRPEGKSLERVNNDGPYSPENCIWAIPKQQARNTRKNVYATIHGETKTLAEWAEISKIPHSRIRARKLLGWPDERLLLPKRGNN